MRKKWKSVNQFAKTENDDIDTLHNGQ